MYSIFFHETDIICKVNIICLFYNNYSLTAFVRKDCTNISNRPNAMRLSL